MAQEKFVVFCAMTVIMVLVILRIALTALG